MKKLFLTLCLFCLFFLLQVSPVNASFGVSPAEINIDYLSPGMVLEKDFLLSRTDLEQDEKVTVDTQIPGADAWLKIDPGISFIIPKGERNKVMKVFISVPRDAQYKYYSGYLNLKIGAVGQSVGVAVVQGVGLKVDLTVTDKVIEKLVIDKIEIPDIFPEDPIKVLITAENQGNSEVKPEKVRLSIKNLLGVNIFDDEEVSINSLAPGIKEDLTVSFNNKLTHGQYSAVVNVIYNSKSINQTNVVFNVKSKEMNTSLVSADNRNAKKDVAKLLGLTLLSIIPITFFWIIIRKSLIKKIN